MLFSISKTWIFRDSYPTKEINKVSVGFVGIENLPSWSLITPILALTLIIWAWWIIEESDFLRIFEAVNCFWAISENVLKT